MFLTLAETKIIAVINNKSKFITIKNGQTHFVHCQVKNTLFKQYHINKRTCYLTLYS